MGSVVNRMKITELTGYLEEHYPAKTAEEWDNVGLLTGDDQGETEHVFLALDLTEPVLEEAIDAGADLILTHHPMIFQGIKKINNHTVTGRKILKLIRHGMSYYAMHTNYDILGMAERSAQKLQLQDTEVLSVTEETHELQNGFGRVGMLPRQMTLLECGKYVKEAFAITDVRIYGDPEKLVTRAAVCTGSGKSMIRDAMEKHADVYITGDIDHHTGLDAVADGLCIIDAGHYGTEYIFMEDMRQELQAAFPELRITCAKVHAPYTTL